MNSEQTYDSQLNPQPEPPAPQSFFNRLIGVYFSPGETFKEIGLAPRLIAPLLVLALVGAIGSWFFVDRVGVEKFTTQGIEQAVAEGKTTQEQADKQIEGVRKAAPYIKASFPLIGFVASIVLVLIVAGLAKLASMMFGFENEFKPLVAVTAYAMLAVGLVATILLVVLINLKPAEEIDIKNPIGSNVTALLAAAGVTLPKFLHHLFTYIDAFYIWRVILLGIGCAAVSRRMKASTGITYAAIVAVIFALLGAAWGTIFG